ATQTACGIRICKAIAQCASLLLARIAETRFGGVATARNRSTAVSHPTTVPIGAGDRQLHRRSAICRRSVHPEVSRQESLVLRSWRGASVRRANGSASASLSSAGPNGLVITFG